MVELLECVYSPSFAKSGAEARFAPDVGRTKTASPRLISGRRGPVSREKSRSLSRDEEVALFLRYNYYRYRLMKILKAHAGKRLTVATTRELLKWDHAALDVRDEIVQANLGLAWIPTPF